MRAVGVQKDIFPLKERVIWHRAKTSQMNDEERKAKEFLEAQRIGAVVFEPDGNIPPDFVVGGRIAVEVRRLNQHFQGPGGEEGLEQIEIPLLSAVREVFQAVGPPVSGRSWFVMYDFSRPLSPFREVKAELERFLKKFLATGEVDPGEVQLNCGLGLRFYPASELHEMAFVLGGYSDHDSGGWLLSELAKNIRIAVEEKTKKIARVRAKYGEWWLLLIDHIAHGLSERDRLQLKETFNLEHDWDRVILLSRLGSEKVFEV